MSPAPVISLVMPAYNTDPGHLRACLDSVLAQSFPGWELCVVDDGSTEPATVLVLDEFAERDSRIRVIHRTANGGIATASNEALGLARGEFVALLDHDDLLKPGALERVVDIAVAQDDVDYLYSDEEYLHTDGTVHVVRKPAWSPERFRSHMYTCHLSVIRTSLAREVGGFRAGYEGSQDYDLVLRVTESARRVLHVPEVLYTWRIHESSFSNRSDTRSAAFDAGRRAIQDHCDRTGIDAAVETTEEPGVYRVRRNLRHEPLVSVVIPTRGGRAFIDGRHVVLVENCLEALLDTSTYRRFEFVVVADLETPPRVLENLRRRAGGALTVVPYDLPFNFSDKCNKGVAASSGEVLLFLNDDTQVMNADWCEAMLGPALEPSVGMVGCLLYFNDMFVQHAGHAYVRGGATHDCMGLPAGMTGPLASVVTQHEVSGVTAAAAMLRRDVFDEVGGFCTDFPGNYNDVDLSLKIRATGRSIIYTPYARMFHFESMTRSGDVRPGEIELLHERWWNEVHFDPYACGHPVVRYPPR